MTVLEDNFYLAVIDDGGKCSPFEMDERAANEATRLQSELERLEFELRATEVK